MRQAPRKIRRNSQWGLTHQHRDAEDEKRQRLAGQPPELNSIIPPAVPAPARKDAAQPRNASKGDKRKSCQRQLGADKLRQHLFRSPARLQNSRWGRMHKRERTSPKRVRLSERNAARIRDDDSAAKPVGQHRPRAGRYAGPIREAQYGGWP